jgi:hypothetical protein
LRTTASTATSCSKWQRRHRLGATISHLAVNGSRISIVKSFRECGGIAIKAAKAADKMPRSLAGARIAVLDVGTARTRVPMGITFRLKNANRLNRTQSEELEQCRRGPVRACECDCDVEDNRRGIGTRHVADGDIAAVAKQLVEAEFALLPE